MKQNSTKNMILSHLEDIKAKIEQKSINNIKLPFEGPFKDKYAGRSPERILCLYSVRLVLGKCGKARSFLTQIVPKMYDIALLNIRHIFVCDGIENSAQTIIQPPMVSASSSLLSSSSLSPTLKLG